MQFPVFQVPNVGHGMIIGTNGVIHVLISHGIAIGLFGMLVISDLQSWKARPEIRPGWDAITRRMLRFIVLSTAVVGAVTGTGIWFTTTALAPRGIASMLRIFFWSWFTEWIVFFLEVVGILTLYFSRKRLASHRFLRISLSFLYALSGFASAALITGNLGFMLTSGAWLERRTFFSAFFNPSFFPQVISRLAIAYVLGALFAIIITITGPAKEQQLRTRALRVFGTSLLVSTIVLALALGWYLIEIPNAFGERAAYAVLTEYLSRYSTLFQAGNILAVLAVTTLAIGAIIQSKPLVKALIIPATILTFGFVAQFERIREFIRGPYIIPGYMYVNSLLLKEQPTIEKNGLLSFIGWQQPYLRQAGARGAGAYLFAQNCSVCHTLNGINPITRRVQDRSDDGLRVIMRHTQELTSFMPPFIGAENERAVAAQFLSDLAHENLKMSSRIRLMPRLEGQKP